jgi:hypothetical protein
MLRGIKATEVRQILYKSMGDCRAFAGCISQQSFDRGWGRHVQNLRRRHIPFGQSAKLVNLYVKAAIGQRGLLSDRDANKISRLAHVPVDSLVLKQIWRDFPDEMKRFGIRRNVSLKRIKRREYDQIQQLLRENAKTSDCVPLDYDFAYLGAER